MNSRASLTLLEAKLPYRELSFLALRDRRATDVSYRTHRWWARRSPSAFRGLLLAATLPAGTDIDHFWSLYGSSAQPLTEVTVYDPFMGGGTTILEAARLGASVIGADVDPLAVEIVRGSLEPPDASAYKGAVDALLAELELALASLYPQPDPPWLPVHYFYVREVTCPSCSVSAVLYRSLVLTRDSGKSGAVRREAPVTVFCPECLSVHSLMEPSANALDCCGRRWPLGDGNFKSGRFECPQCHRRSRHQELQTGLAPNRLLAVEETAPGRNRRIRKALPEDVGKPVPLGGLLPAGEALVAPTGAFNRHRQDPRPVSYGLSSPRDLFTQRQLTVFGLAFALAAKADGGHRVRSALRLGISQALTSNNVLCSYAPDYGRLAPLFSIRSYALPALSVELNPLHPTAGRGTLRRALARFTDLADPDVRRYVWDGARQQALPATLNAIPLNVPNSLTCVSAEFPNFEGRADVCLFDPPYFDFIAYDELSEFYRAWLEEGQMGGHPVFPTADDPVHSFADHLSRCLSATMSRMKPGAPMAFTYHSANELAWAALGRALDGAGLRVTAVWPLANDAHMGHHSYDGNCEWDLVLSCRPSRDCMPLTFNVSSDALIQSLSPLAVSEIDRRNIKLGLAMVSERYGVLRHSSEGT